MSAVQRPEWGPWTYNPDFLTLDITVGVGYIYEVDLERMPTSAGMLDWIFQIASKEWATTEVVSGLIQVLNDCLDPQSTYCSFGAERTNPLYGDDLRDAISLRIARAERVSSYFAEQERRERESAAAGGAEEEQIERQANLIIESLLTTEQLGGMS